MPRRPLTDAKAFLLPPTLDELIPDDHPVRFVGVFVDTLTQAEWQELGIATAPSWRGAPSYHPRLLLSVWLYGFMTGVRSTRTLAAACRDQLPYLWLTGWQQPDHNTLWRFYQHHRAQLRPLLVRTVRTAITLGLLDLRLQAIDGTKLIANAAKERTLDAAHLTQALARIEAAIADLEAQGAQNDAAAPPRLPAVLANKQQLREQVEQALATIQAEDGPPRLNLTDEDAQIMKGRTGFLAGYNGQAMVSPLDPATAGSAGMLITAVALTTQPNDQGQLLGMVAEAEAVRQTAVDLTLADGGYHAATALADCAEQGIRVAIPELRAGKKPFHTHAGFAYDAARDCYDCPQGQQLLREGNQPRAAGQIVYRARGAVCRACPLFGTCTTNKRGRTLVVSAQDATLERHRAWMKTPEAKLAYRQRKQIVEPVFGILKEQQCARRVLLRGQQQVQAEWQLLATAFNLRTLGRLWAAGRYTLTRAAAGGVA